METIVYLLLWAVLIVFMMRFGCGAHLAGRRADTAGNPPAGGQADLRWIAPATDTDPVCGDTVRPEHAKPSVHAGQVYYFCSRECREAFEAAPHLYPGGAKPERLPMENSHA